MILKTSVDRLYLAQDVEMPLKPQIILFTLQVNSKTLQRFALDLKPQTIVAALVKGYGHYL